MNNDTYTETRYCSVTESLLESFKEIKSIREGKTTPLTLDDLWAECEKCKEEIAPEVIAC